MSHVLDKWCKSAGSSRAHRSLDLIERVLWLSVVIGGLLLLICIAAQAATRDPLFSMGSSTLNSPRQIAISIPYNGETRFTTDGTTPTGSSTLYTKPIQVSWTQTVKAISIVSAVSSNVVSKTYTLDSQKFPAPSAGGTTAPVINLQRPVIGQ